MHFVGCYAVSYFNYAGSSWCFLINQKKKKNYTSNSTYLKLISNQNIIIKFQSLYSEVILCWGNKQ